MSFKFIVELIMMLGLGGALYIIARTLPRIDDADTKPQNPLAPSWLIEYFEKGDETGIIISATVELGGKQSTVKATVVDNNGHRIVTKILRYVQNERFKDKLELKMTAFPGGHVKLAEEAIEAWIQTVPQEEWEEYTKRKK